ncbi:helix-turn-helix transcriptional regulator [Roseburia hominis]
MGFARTLKDLRESRDVTQDELAKYLNVSRSTIAGYETKERQPDFDKLIKIAQYFQVPIDYLLTGKSTDAVMIRPAPAQNAKVVDKKVLGNYKKLDFEDRKSVLKYIQLLKQQDKYRE